MSKKHTRSPSRRIQVGHSLGTISGEALALLFEEAERESWESINLCYKQIVQLPRGIGKAARTKWLVLLSNFLEELPAEVAGLSELQVLMLGSNALRRFPPSILRLPELRQLDLSDNYILKIPIRKGQLRRLHSLNLNGNSIGRFPEELCNLMNIKWLNLSFNSITAIPDRIRQLTELETLEINNNAIKELPLGLCSLAKLESLSLANNSLMSLPSELSRLSSLRYLDLRGNPLPIPPEILKKVENPRAILDFYSSVSGGSRKRQLNEVKVLLVGQGAVGKTSIVQRLLHDAFNEHQQKTDGIAINQYVIPTGRTPQLGLTSMASTKPENKQDGGQIQLNIWDFGGQEIMHATHQFFLTKRSVYLLVLDARLTLEENRAEYWLKLIQSFGGDSPVLVIGNKIDQHPFDIDRTGLRNKYPSVAGIVETSAATGSGIAELRRALANLVDTLPHVHDEVPESWFRVKSRLEALGKQKNYLTYDEYLALCSEDGISEPLSQQTLIGFLHDLGVTIYFQDDPRLVVLGIFNPQWVTNGVYKILNSGLLFQNRGTLTLPLLNDILNLSEYPPDKRLFIVDMMKKFELCYDIVPDRTFLIPDLLPRDEPFTGKWDDALAFQIHYNVLPSSIISRFIVRMNSFIFKTVWRSGAILKRDGNIALVKSDPEDKRIYIWIGGDEFTRRDFLSAIRTEFDAIHRTLAKIEATEEVPIPNFPYAHPINYRLLLQLEAKGVAIHYVQSGDQLIEINVRFLLDGIEHKEDRETKNLVLNIGGDVTDSNVIVGDDNSVTLSKRVKKVKDDARE